MMMIKSKILLVEDEPGIASFIVEGLTEEGYEVHWAENGEKGWNAVNSADFDLFLLDWMLPHYSGLEICQMLREKKYEQPVIFLTARDTVQDTVEALKSGADDYMKKPFHFEELLARIEVQLRKNDVGSKELSLGSIVVKSGSREVFLEGNPVHLTQKEFDLLHYLLLHKNSVCERKKIIEEVWDIHFDYDTSVLDVYMNSIRKKLKLHVENDILQTVRGVGFIAKDI